MRVTLGNILPLSCVLMLNTYGVSCVRKSHRERGKEKGERDRDRDRETERERERTQNFITQGHIF